MRGLSKPATTGTILIIQFAKVYGVYLRMNGLHASIAVRRGPKNLVSKFGDRRGKQQFRARPRLLSMQSSTPTNG